MDWASSLQKNKTQLRKHKAVHFTHPETRSHNCTSRQQNRAKPPKNLVLGLKKWIGRVCCEKTRHNFGSTKWCTVCTPKPDLTTGTSRQQNRAKPRRNLVLGLKKWIGHVRCEKNKTQIWKHKVVHCMHPKPRSHNGYLPATESRETAQKLCFGPKDLDWASSLR